MHHDPSYKLLFSHAAMVEDLLRGFVHEEWVQHLDLLLDEGCYSEQELAGLKNIVAALFRLENSRAPEDVQRVLEALVEWLKAPEQLGLRRAFTVWLKRVFLPGRLPGVDLPEIHDLQEVKAMLEDHVVEWTRQWEQQGIEKGRQEGRQEGEAALLVRQLERKFGPLDEPTQQRIAAADSDTLLRWGERLLTANSLTEVFDNA